MPSMYTADERISKLDDKSLEVMQIDTQNRKKSDENGTQNPRSLGQYQMVQHTFR